MAALTEDELDVLVSIAIRRAELLDEERSPAAADAWHEVMLYERRLAEVTSAADVAGGVARSGAVRAALAAGERAEAERLASLYLADPSLSLDRREAIERALLEDRERRRSTCQTRRPVRTRLGGAPAPKVDSPRVGLLE